MRFAIRAVLVLSSLRLSLQAADKFQVRYFYDRNDSELHLTELRFLSEKRAIAIGTLSERGNIRGATVETNDGGATWQVQPFKETPRSIFFLDSSLGWIVTEKGIWQTEEGGRSWRKLKSMKGVVRVHFLNPQRGFAVGGPKLFLETSDGGKNWTKVPEGDKPETRPENTVYSLIGFANERDGFVSGFSMPPRRRDSHLPDWMEPEDAQKRSQRPGVMLLIETRDAGVTWKSAITSVFGRVSRISLAPSMVGLAVFQFDDTFEWPSEVYRLMLRTGGSDRVFREKDRLVTDTLLLPSGTAYLAAVEPSTPVRSIPIPGRVKFLRSDGPQYTLWQSIDVDYRATGQRVSLAAGPADSVWAVTDQGMILSLGRSER